VKKTDRFRKELVGSTTSILVLSVLRESPTYGYHLAQIINERSGGLLKWREGTIYPMLHRLEKQGLIKGKWQVSDTSKPKRVYSLTDAGLLALKQQHQEWDIFSAIIDKILGGSYA
jgi:PadR family transcriptional regulator, regulatory protein PadR